MELIAADRPGLLNSVGQVFVEHHLDIYTAKIMTIGERAEDAFYVVDHQGAPLSKELAEKLRAQLIDRLDSEST